ncbi:MAG: PssD/Cps14F family polysaccharide biosynthesis glycosyltransferase [Promethearchaeota archaeon]
MKSMTILKICLVCSHGGHLMQMLSLKEAFRGHDFFLVTHKRRYSVPLDDIPKVYLIPYLFPDFQHKYISRIVLFVDMVMETLAEFIILLKERPDIVISTGSEIAIPIFYMAKSLRKKVVFIESLHRVSDLSGSAKIVYPIVDLLLVQWESLLERYSKAIYVGRVI